MCGIVQTLTTAAGTVILRRRRRRPQEFLVNIDQVKGRVETAVGKVKELTGRMIRSTTLESRGRHEEIVGKARAGYGDAKANVTRRGHVRA
jgi:uncharacterized protein YjbJ (UPF0337 family)